MDVPPRHRPLVLLAALLLAQVLLLAFQIRRGSDVPLIRVWSAELLTPLQRGGTFLVAKLDSVWFGYIDLRNVHKENRQLTKEVGDLRLKNQQLEGQAAQAVRFSRLLGFREENADIPMVAAEVIGANADSTSQTVFINRGDHDGIRKNMAVITPDGVVGKISEALPHTSQVLLITDRESGVGALLAGTRAHGVVKGAGNPLLWMDYVSADEKVPAGEQVLTSGEDRIFPKNLPLGWVSSTKAGFPFQTIEVTPAAHLDRLEEVLVLLSEKPFNLRPAGKPALANQAEAGEAQTPRVPKSTQNSAPAGRPPSRATANTPPQKKLPEPSAKKVAASPHPGTPQ